MLAQPAPPSAPTSPPSQEDKSYKTLMAMLRKHTDALPQELQALLNDAAIRDGQAETKQMHAAVAAHGRAKKELQHAHLARYNLHAAWRGFLTQAVELWKGYSESFTDQERQLTERVQAAQEALSAAKENLAKSKSTMGMENKDETMTVSDEETDKTDKDLPHKTADKIKEGLVNLHTSLDALRQSADQAVEDEQKALKRPRLEEKPIGVSGSMPSENAVPNLP